MFLAGSVLLYLFGTSLINAQKSVYVQKLAWYKSLSPSEWEQGAKSCGQPHWVYLNSDGSSGIPVPCVFQRSQAPEGTAVTSCPVPLLIVQGVT